MTLDEAIAREKQLEKEQRSHIGTWDDEYSKKCEVYAEEHEQRAQWLEELKSNRIALEKANGYLEVNHRLGYNKAIDDAVNEIVSVKSEVAEKEHFDTHLFTVLAQRQNEIIKLIKKLKEGNKNDD